MKKPKLQLVKNEVVGKQSNVVKAMPTRPKILIVPANKITAERGLGARNYLQDEEENEEALAPVQGSSRIYPEINVLKTAKLWYLAMLREARMKGFDNMKGFLGQASSQEKQLFNAVKKFVDWEQKRNDTSR